MENKSEIYDLIKKLKEYIYSVKKADGSTFDILLSEIKGFISSNNILCKKYTEYVNNFEKESKTAEYQEITYRFYNYILSMYKILIPVNEQALQYKYDNYLEEDTLKKYLMLLGNNLYYPEIIEKLYNFQTEEIMDDIIDIKELEPDFSIGILHFYFFVALKTRLSNLGKLKNLECQTLFDMLSFISIQKNIRKWLNFYFMELADDIGIFDANAFTIELFKIATIEALIQLTDDIQKPSKIKAPLVNYLHSEILIKQLLRTETEPINFDAYPELKQLTAREREIFNLIGLRYTTKEIAEMPNFITSMETVKNQITSCAKKLQDTGLTQKLGKEAIKEVYETYSTKSMH